MSSAATLNLFATAMANNTAALEGIVAQNNTLSESALASAPSMFLKRKTEKDYVSNQGGECEARAPEATHVGTRQHAQSFWMHAVGLLVEPERRGLLPRRVNRSTSHPR
eukprot:COSAG05_NODE_16559_length_343_cov_0.979508_1_plen_108_part_10